MKISMLSYSDIIGGAYRAAYRIHRALIDSKIDSTLFTVSPTSGDPTVVFPKGNLFKYSSIVRPYLGYLPSKLAKYKGKALFSSAMLPSGWPKRLNSFNTDIVHLQWVNNETLSIKDVAKIQKPLVWTLHDMWAFCGAEHYSNDLRYIEGYNYNNRKPNESRFDLNKCVWDRKFNAWKSPFEIIAPSRWLADCAKNSKLMSDWPITIIPYPLDTEFWQPVDKQIARKLLGLPLNRKLVLFGASGGAVDPRKGFDLLFSALKKLQGIESNLDLVVFGERRPKELPNLEFPMHYLGHLYDDLTLKILYSAADIMILPSRQDNLPLTGMEALSTGTPIVAFNTGGLPDLVLHKETGYLALPFDTDDLANGIQWILKDEQRQKYLSNNSVNLAIKNFSNTKVAESYKLIYNKLLKN